MKKKLIKLLSVVLVIAIGSVGCTKKESNQEDVTQHNIQESEYINLTMLFPKTINPIVNQDKSVGYVMNLIYDGLFEIDDKYNVETRLVDKYEKSSDGKEILINLKEDAKWHDGKEVTSSDVKFTVDLIKKTKESPYLDLVKDIEYIKIKDNKEFSILLKKNDPFIIDKLIFPIVSQTKLNNLNKNQEINYKNNLIGNGPYKIKSYVDRKHMILEKNEEYFGDVAENRKEIFVKMVPDKQSQIETVLSLDSDIASIGIGELSKFESKKEFNVTKYEGRDYEMIMFNYENEFLNNKNIRKAIISSINREQILEESYLGNATLSHFPLNTSSKYYNNDIENIEYSEEKSLDYLYDGLLSLQENKELEKSSEQESDEEVGQDEEDANDTDDEISEEDLKKLLNEEKLTIIVSEDNNSRIKVAYTISKDLEDIGIKTEIKELSEEDFVKTLDSKKYDLAVLGYELSSIPDARAILKDCNIPDDILENYMTNLDDAKTDDEVKTIYNKIQNYINEQGSFISLGILENFVVSNKRLNGEIHPNDFDIYKSISNLQMNK